MSLTRNIELLAWAPAAVGAGLTLWAAGRLIARLRRLPANRCPGPGRSMMQRLAPWNWLSTGVCGYDLSASPRDERGACQCPECGSVHAQGRRMSRVTHRRRVLPLGIACLAAALIMHEIRWIRSCGWVPYTPSWALVLGQRMFGPLTPSSVAWELDSRVHQGRLWNWERAVLLANAVDSLRDDDVSWNGSWGLSVIGMLGEEAIPALEACLRSDDWQQRQLAAKMLRDRTTEPAKWLWWSTATGTVRPYEPTADLLVVSVEALRDDSLPFGPRGGSGIANAWDSVEFLTHWAQRARPLLARAIYSSDAQQRRLAAVIIARAGLKELRGVAADVLAQQLANDEVYDNATSAGAALLELGTLSLPALERAQSQDDRQGRVLARALYEQIAADRGVSDDTDARAGSVPNNAQDLWTFESARWRAAR